MKIAQVAPLYESVPPRLYGGTERVVSNLTEELVAMGHEVTLFASGDSETRAELIPIVDKALRLDPHSVDPLAPHILMMEKVFSNSKQFDLIHFHVDHIQLPLIQRYGGATLSTFHGRLDIPDLVPLYRQYSDLNFTSISNSQRNPLPWLNWRGTVYHGLNPNDFRFYEKQGDYLAFLGRISPEKGVEDSIAIAKQFGMKLKIAAKVGDADQKYFVDEIEHLLEDPLIEFIGEIGENEKNDFLGKAFATLFPIAWPEPFGLVMIESMACGTPVIAFRRGSVPEVMIEERSGFIVDHQEGALTALTKVRDFHRALARQVFEERFTAKRMAGDYVKIYETLVEHAKETAA
jgi:glycosyltransferase involved in cell wall biosynthesis